MPWQQLKLHTKAEHSEALEQHLLDLGALSITLLDAHDQPIFQKEPGHTQLWDEVVLQCLFDEKTELDVLINWLGDNPVISNRDSLVIETLEDEDWERRWMDNFEAMQFGERLWICPSWQEPPDPAAVNIMLDPGLAFGSGTHATTALCLQWLEQAGLRNCHVIDYGCGSGVLAIAAVLLGAARVDAVDHDAQAITASEANRARNGIDAERLRVYLPQDFHAPPADVVIANILYEPLITLAPRLREMTKPGGRLLLSGVLEEQANDLATHYQQWFTIDSIESRDGWIALAATRA